MIYVSFEEFILHLKTAPRWRLEKGDSGLTLLTTDLDGTVRVFHSPDPKKSSDVDWGIFAGRIGHVIDMQGGII